MSLSEMKRFTEDLKKQSALQDEVKAAGSDPEAIVKVAKGKGYDFTAEELKAAAAENKGEMSEEQLDKVAGGTAVATVVVVTVVAT